MSVKALMLTMLLSALSGTGQCSDHTIEIDNFLTECHNRHLFNGTVLVAKGDSVVFSKGYGLANREWETANGPETRYRIGSISKQFITVMIFQLVESGKLRLDDLLGKYVPEFREDIGSRVTVDHMLRHMSGIPSYTTERFWNEFSRDSYSHEEFIDLFLSRDLEFEPGSVYSYSNTNSYLLGVILERVTGQSYDENLRVRILEPLGMESTGVDDHRSIIPNRASNYMLMLNRVVKEPWIDMANTFGCGSLYSTVDDMMKWNRAFEPGVLLSDSTIKKIMTPYDRINKFYGRAYSWTVFTMRPRDAEDVVWLADYNGHLFGAYATITRMIDEGYLIVIMSNHGKPAVTADEIVNILNGNEYQIPPTPIKEGLGWLVGEYGMDSALAVYEQVKRDHPRALGRMEIPLNELGYDLLRLGRPDDAVVILGLNAKDHPRSPNAWDSYAEALAAAGDTSAAIVNYRKALDRDPGNTNAMEMIRLLKGE